MQRCLLNLPQCSVCPLWVIVGAASYGSKSALSTGIYETVNVNSEECGFVRWLYTISFAYFVTALHFV